MPYCINIFIGFVKLIGTEIPLNRTIMMEIPDPTASCVPGEAKEAVTAIFAWPILATASIPAKSPALAPHPRDADDKRAKEHNW